jgi:hypothetical protein
MDFYQQLKLKNDILSVANGLGYNGKRTGSCYQGDCPKHGSTQGICLVLFNHEGIIRSCAFIPLPLPGLEWVPQYVVVNAFQG